MLSPTNRQLIADTFGLLVVDPNARPDGMVHIAEEGLNRLLDAARAQPAAVEGAALSASDRACYEYPGEDQAALRAAFVAGACFVAENPPSTPALDEGAAGGLDEPLRWFLRVIEAAGGEVCSSENPHNPINVFCDDRGDGTDTFNLSEECGYTFTSHDTIFDSSTTRLTDKGRQVLAAIRAHPFPPPAADDDRARDNQPLKTDEGGCVTKRFVIFNRPGMAPEKKGGWLQDEHLIDFLREVMLLDCWTPGFRATVLELTWDNDLWASSASEYLSVHDHAIGPRRARKAWREARDKHERIYNAPPSMPLGQEIATYHQRTSPSPAPADMVREVLEFYGNEARWDAYDEDQRAAQFDRNTGSDFNERGQKARDLLAALKWTAAKEGGAK